MFVTGWGDITKTFIRLYQSGWNLKSVTWGWLFMDTHGIIIEICSLNVWTWTFPLKCFASSHFARSFSIFLFLEAKHPNLSSSILAVQVRTTNSSPYTPWWRQSNSMRLSSDRQKAPERRRDVWQYRRVSPIVSLCFIAETKKSIINILSSSKSLLLDIENIWQYWISILSLIASCQDFSRFGGGLRSLEFSGCRSRRRWCSPRTSLRRRWPSTTWSTSSTPACARSEATMQAETDGRWSVEVLGITW